MNGLTCPKCQGQMRSYERSGVTVDQCSECRGIFLDRGELERLMRAEGTYNEQTYQTYRRERSDFDHDDDDDDDYRYREGHHQGRPYKKKRKNFLEDLLDFG